jgi:tetratricopeptide (TPR) repeat protein
VESAEIMTSTEDTTSINSVFYRAVTEMIQSDQIEKALDELKGFLELNTNDEIALSLYGSALMRNGETERALSTFKLITKEYPENAGAQANLAFVAMKTGDQNLAIESYENATRISPERFSAWIHLSKLHFDAGNFEAAVNAFDSAIKVDPLDQEFMQMQEAMQARDFVQTEHIAHSMLAKHPRHPRAILLLSVLARNAGAYEERIAMIEDGLNAYPANTNLRQAMVLANQDVGKFEIALEQAKLMVKIKPDHMTYWTLSRACDQAGDHIGALANAEKSASYLDTKFGELGKTDLLRGHALKVLGRRAESEAAYRASIHNTSGSGAGWWALADLKTYQFSTEDKRAMEAYANNENEPIGQCCQAAFALARAHENDDDHAEAFRWYEKANSLRRDRRFSAESNKDQFDTVIAEFDADMLVTQANPAPTGPTPIFIIGMPRAGSTLIEQILASHSQIEGTMELMNLQYAERAVKIAGQQKFSKDYPRSLGDFSADELSAFGQSYLEDTAVFRTSKPFFIDKLPPNFTRVGLIHKILPQAIIIDARRHPIDCGFSLYKQHFAGGHGYSYKLDDIGQYYNDYLRLMDHWDIVLPGKVKLVQYEDTVHDTENIIRQMLDHIGVDFEEACLRFFDNKRQVKTASSEQVRQPIYTQAIGRWQAVSEQLKPLIESLGEETLARFQGSKESP